MTTNLVQAAIRQSIVWGMNWWMQSLLLTAVGLILASSCRRIGAATQSAIYRTTLLCILMAPAVSMTVGWFAIGHRIAVAPMIAPTDPDGGQRWIQNQDWSSVGRGVEFQRDQVPIGVNALAETASSTAYVPTEHGPDNSRMSIISIAPVTPAFGPDNLFALIAICFSLAWLLTSMVLLVRLCRSCWLLRSINRGSIDVDPATTAECQRLARSFGVRCPQLRRSPFVSSPCTVGFIRPAILLSDESPLDLRDVLAHELAHIRRRDALWNLLRSLATCCLAPQPLVWILSSRMEASAEEICDDYAMSLGADRNRYAEQLYRLAALNLPVSIAAGMKTPRTALGRRVQRILDSTRQLSTGIGRRSGIVITLTGLTFMGLASLVVVGDEQPSSSRQIALADGNQDVKPEQKTGDADKPDSPLRFRGRVVDANGRPIIGARIYRRDASEQTPLQKSSFEQAAMTDSDGRFAFDLRPDAFHYQRPITVVAAKEGYSVGWTPVSQSDDPSDLTVKLIADNSVVEGKFFDLEGRPVAGAVVRIERIEAFANEDPQPYFQAIEKGEINPPQPEKHLFLQQPDVNPLLSAARTTDDGQFRFTSIGRGRRVKLNISGEGIENSTIELVSEPLAEPLRFKNHSGVVYGSRFIHHVRPSRPIVGRVTVFKTEMPIQGATVRWVGSGDVATETDADGRFELKGCPKLDKYQLCAYPPKGQPYVLGSVEIPGAPGLNPIETEIHVYPAIPVVGRVVDEVTGRPVSALVTYRPLFPNEHITHGLGYSAVAVVGEYSFTSSRPDGTFEIYVIPGQGCLGVHLEQNEFEPAEVDAVAFFQKQGVAYGLDDWKDKSKELLVTSQGTGFGALPQSYFNGIALLNVPVDAQPLTQDIHVKSKTKKQ